MKRSALAFAFVATLAGAAPHQGSILLRRKFTAGAVDRYNMTTSMHMSMSGAPGANGGMNMTNSTSGKIDMKTISVAPGGKSAKIQVRTHDFQMTGAGAGHAPQDATSTMTIDSLGKSTAVEVNGRSGMHGMSFDQMGAAAFPQQPVKVGDSWTVSAPKNPFLSGGQMKMKLIGQDSFHGKAVWVITSTGTFTMDGSSGAGMTGTMHLSGKSLVSKADGNTLSSTMDMTMKSTMKNPQASKPMDMSMSMHMTLDHQ